VGVVLADGFDDALRAGERPRLDVYVSGESRASQRFVLGAIAIDLIRGVEARPSPVRAVTAAAGKGLGLPIEDLVVLGLLLWPLLVCSTLVPGLMLVQENEARTLEALMVTPTTMTEVLLAKGALGFGMAMVMCLVTLLLSGALTAQPLPLLTALAVSVALCTGIGLVYGMTARQSKTVYNLAQTMNVFILAPLIFYFFPGWPQWIAKLFPSYYFIDPLYRIALKGATLAEVGSELAVALAAALLLIVPVALLARRL
jgi:ABC-2 type transport system permease protein